MNRHRDEIDKLIDAALDHYPLAELPPGFSQAILARIAPLPAKPMSRWQQLAPYRLDLGAAALFTLCFVLFAYLQLTGTPAASANARANLAELQGWLLANRMVSYLIVIALIAEVWLTFYVWKHWIVGSNKITS